MATLPAQHPTLAIHMTDRATTPLISSASSSTSSTSPSSSSKPRPQQPHHSKQQRKRHPTTFSTSPPSSASPSSSTPSSASEDEDDDEDEEPPSPASRQADALTSLSATALLSYDAAKRLGRGAPLRTMVEYPDGGAVVLHSYMCPMGLALGVPGRNASNTSLHTAAGAVGSASGSANGGDEHHHHHGDDDDAGGGGVGGSGAVPRAQGGDHGGRPNRSTPTRPLSFALDPVIGDDGGGGGGGGGDMEGIDPSDPPMLTSTVVAPRAEDLREARRATARLEKVARGFQAEWVSTGRR